MFHRMMNYGELDTKPTIVLTKDLIKKSLPKYKRHDDLIIIQEAAWEEFKRALPVPVVKEENSPFSIDEDELASLVCQIIQKPICRRLAVEKTVKNDNFRTPNIELILGDNGIVDHKENQITYRFDITKCMFSFGNIREKMRMAELNCSDEIVVDLFAGIGYFSLPLLIHAKAKHLYACEWNPDAIDAFKKNLVINKVDTSRCTIVEGDNRKNRPTDVAQRVILGILPSCLDWMQTAFECIDKSTGATLHCHDLVESQVLKSTNNSSETSSTNNLVSNSTAKMATSTTSSDQNNKQQTLPSSQSALLANQSLSSSSSSHSIIENLTTFCQDDKMASNESDKDTSSPVLLDKPIESCMAATNSLTTTDTSVNNQNDSLSCSSNIEDNIIEPIQQSSDQERTVYEARGNLLVNQIKEDADAHDLSVNLVHIQPVKSYAPHITHVVFDIKIEPKSLISKVYEPSIFSNIITTDNSSHA